MEKESHHVPTWDGAAKGSRRYAREVCWYVRSTAISKRRCCALKLIGRLTGPARLLAMSWGHMDFDNKDGTKELLRRLAASPLVGGHCRMLQPYASSTLPSSGIPTSRCMPFWLESPWDIKKLWKQSFASGKTKKASNSKTRTLDCLMILNHPAMTTNGGTVKVGMMLIGNLLRNLRISRVSAPAFVRRRPRANARQIVATLHSKVHGLGSLWRGYQPRALLVRRGFTFAPTAGASAG